MPTVLLDVPEKYQDEYCTLLSDEGFSHDILNSREGVFEHIFTVEVTGSEIQVAEATRLLSLMGHYFEDFYVTQRKLASTINVAKNTGLEVLETLVSFSIFGKPVIHLLKVRGIKADLANFKKLK